VAVRMFERITGIESDKINTGNLALAQDAQEALVELTAGDLSYGYYNMTVLALGNTVRDANRSAEVIASALRSVGFAITRERQGLMSAFLGSLPGKQQGPAAAFTSRRPPTWPTWPRSGRSRVVSRDTTCSAACWAARCRPMSGS